jgi:glycosyltransferase involved in cell wall biosynthesis
MSDNSICRLTALAYNKADHVFITNGDCLDFAKQIGVTRYTPMLHPVDEEQIRAAPPNSLGLREKLGVKYLFLCTLRHDWAIKGTDKYIRALPKIVTAIGSDFRLLMTRWGAELEASMALAKTLGVDHLIEWIDPLNKQALIRAQKSVDILFDQIALPHFGATAPEGIAAGVPVIMSYDPKSTEWIVAEPAPILSAWTIDEIVENVKIALEPAWLRDYRRRAEAWIDRHHNCSIILSRHLEVYRQLLPV